MKTVEFYDFKIVVLQLKSTKFAKISMLIVINFSRKFVVPIHSK